MVPASDTPGRAALGSLRACARVFVRVERGSVRSVAYQECLIVFHEETLLNS